MPPNASVLRVGTGCLLWGDEGAFGRSGGSRRCIWQGNGAVKEKRQYAASRPCGPRCRAPPGELPMTGSSCTPSPVMKKTRLSHRRGAASSLVVSRSRAMPVGDRRSAVARHRHRRRYVVSPRCAGRCRSEDRRSRACAPSLPAGVRAETGIIQERSGTWFRPAARGGAGLKTGVPGPARTVQEKNPGAGWPRGSGWIQRISSDAESKSYSILQSAWSASAASSSAPPRASGSASVSSSMSSSSTPP